MWHRIAKVGAISRMVGLRRRYAPRNDGVWHRIAKVGAISRMVGLRRRYAPRNDEAWEPGSPQ
ncbi:MAG: hypothetical protein HON55_03475 [Legionellales bacterium]|nr:hypothetical protein [Legionellales bacterium]